MDTRITVLIPVADAEKTIELALRSTLRALDPDSSILVYDDASIDNTVALVRRTVSGDRRIGLIEGESRVGVARGLNLLLEEANTHLVARMDGDDIVLPGRFRRQVREIVESDVEVTFTSRINFGKSWENYLPSLPRHITPRLMPWLMLRANPVAHSSMLARKSAMIGVGGYREAVAEDYDLWLRMLAVDCQFSSLATPGIAYRRHADQVTRQGSWLMKVNHDPLLRHSFNMLANKLGIPGDAWERRNSSDEVAADVLRAIRALPFLDRLGGLSV